MIKHDALRRALGAAWVVTFLLTLLLPVGTGVGAARPALADDDVDRRSTATTAASSSSHNRSREPRRLAGALVRSPCDLAGAGRA